MTYTGLTIYPICPREGCIAGDVHSVAATDRANFKMLWSIARHQRPSCGHDHRVELVLVADRAPRL